MTFTEACRAAPATLMSKAAHTKMMCSLNAQASAMTDAELTAIAIAAIREPLETVTNGDCVALRICVTELANRTGETRDAVLARLD